MKKFCLLAVLLASAAIIAAELPVLEMKQWKLAGLSAEVIGNRLRLREVGAKQTGNAKIRVNVRKAKYLQITAGASEDPDHYVTVSNVSERTTPRGPIFQGVNTFRLPEKNFALALTLRGPKGTQPGGWYDINSIKTVNEPVGGLVISAEKNTLQNGDEFKVEYFAGEKLADKTVEVKAFLANNMANVSFGSPIVLNDEGKNGDAKANDHIYSALVKISNHAHNMGKSAVLFSVTLADGSSSYGTPAFAFDIKTANDIQKTASRLTPLAAKYRAMWEKAVNGKVNLALGKKVDFSVKPNFYLTSVGKNKKVPNTDATDLTDGKLTRRGDDVLRFDSQAVGWRSAADLSSGIDLVVDLGKVEPVGKAVIRINCGDRQNQVQRSPRRFEVLVSKDGKLFYPAGTGMIKLQPGEKDQSNFVNQYYLEENDSSIFCYPFELAVNANARYVMINIVPDGGNLYCDELAILKAENTTQATDQVYSGTPKKRLSGGVELTPSQNGGFYVADNLPAPNYFRVRDIRQKARKKDVVKMVLELPENIVCLNKEVAAEKFRLAGKNYVRYQFSLPADPKKYASFMEHFGVFLQAQGKVPAGSMAYFYALINNKKSHVAQREIKVITIPETPVLFKGLTVISRMGIGNDTFPGYFENLKKMGFSGAQIYPYMMQRTGVDRFTDEYSAKVEKARKLGYKIVFGYNGLLDMYKYNKHGGEVYCQDLAQKQIKCPTYRGEFYHKELDKITRAVAKFKPDYIQWDIEMWGHSMPFVRKCSRCAALQKKSGKNWEDFLDDVSVELNTDLNEAVAKGARQGKCPMPLLYNYNRQPLNRSYQGFEKWSLNGKFVDGGQPSLYVAGNELRVHNNIRSNYLLQKDKSKRVLAPVLTPGTYGAYEPYHLEQMIYETMLNGAKGFFYYPWRGFVSPIYFYYHAKAMQNVIKYQDLILSGEIYTPDHSDKNLTLSGVKNDNEALILAGNYLNPTGSWKITPPFADAVIYDVLNGRNLSKSELENLEIKAGKIRLLHFRKK